jgi:hypothetical protein
MVVMQPLRRSATSTAQGRGTIQSTNAKHKPDRKFSVSFHVQLPYAAQRKQDQHHVLCDCTRRVCVREGVDVHALASNIPVPEGLDRCAGEDGEKEDDQSVDDDPAHYNVADDADAWRRKDLKVEHAQRNFDKPQSNGIDG